MKARTAGIKLGLVAMALGVWVPALGQTPVISSFSQNGELVCTNLQPGSVATVEWASSVTGPWTNNWAGLDAVLADSNGMIRVSVPMFYRVRATTNFAPVEMVLIPEGSFTMGNCMDTNEGSAYELPLHMVYVSGFHMDKYEVTKALWNDVYNWAITNGYSFENGAQGKALSHPAQSMTWFDAVKWCNARSEKEGRTPAYYTSAAQTVVYRTGTNDLQESYVNWSSGYRLPTEAEWEKAARGGASGQRFSWGNTISWNQANYNASPTVFAYDANPTEGYHPTFATGGYPYTSPAGYFAPNGYGLYDMAGNVWEWCWDRYLYGAYSSGAQTDPRGPTSGWFRECRGGSWSNSALNARSAATADNYPTATDFNVGFRCVRAAGQ